MMERKDIFDKDFNEAERAYENDEMERAVSLFSELATHGVPEACRYLGLIYKTGDGISADEEQSRFWYSRHIELLSELAQRGDAQAVLTLGKIYQYGDNVEKNESEARFLFEQAAEAGLPEAQFHLATLYLQGWCGYKRDEQLYQYWLNRAVANGYPEALYSKGLDFIEKEATYQEGFALIKRAAESGFWPAEDYLDRRRKKGTPNT